METSTLPLIGFAGRKRHGKNRAAAHLLELGYQPVAFADPLRAVTAAIDPIVEQNLETDLHGAAYEDSYTVRWAEAVSDLGYEAAKDEAPEVRRALVAVGQAVRDVLGVEWGLNELLGGNGLWVALADRRIRAALAHKRLEGLYAPDQRITRHWRTLLAFTDVRFPGEADLIRSHGGLIVRIVRPGLEIPADEDITETALDDYRPDYVVVNDGTPRGFELAMRSLVRDIT